MSISSLELSTLPEETHTRSLCQAVHHSLEDMKALNIVFINVKDISSVCDVMAIASGSSNRHVKSISDSVMEHCKKEGFEILGCEGQENSEWVLIDVGDVLVHVMQEQTRDFYELEKLWSHRPGDEAANEDELNT